MLIIAFSIVFSIAFSIAFSLSLHSLPNFGD